MRIDCHLHTAYTDSREMLADYLKNSGFDGCVALSDFPKCGLCLRSGSPLERMDAVLSLTRGLDYAFPFYFINPTEPDAAEQVEMAVDKGIAGFKIICFDHMPGDERALPVYEKIAQLNRPIIFHSGILWDGRNASGNFNRPCNFEALLAVDGLRFALAHMSWPWVDECLAVYGKFKNSFDTQSGSTSEMFLDLSPGTPLYYREAALKLLFGIGYDVENNIIYGIDNFLSSIKYDVTQKYLDLDEKVFNQIPLSDEVKDKIYYKNLLRFIKG